MIQKVQTNDTVTKNESETLDAIYKFYSNLYTSHQIKDADIFLEDIQVDGLTPELNEHCKSVITHSECQYVIDTMKTNTSPGLDGLTSFPNSNI